MGYNKLHTWEVYFSFMGGRFGYMGCFLFNLPLYTLVGNINSSYLLIGILPT
jgi:hypothetical protein